jgi:transposase
VDLALLERYDLLITDLELTIVRQAKRHDGDAFHRLRSVPGIGKVLALTILYEIHDITRFDRVCKSLHPMRGWSGAPTPRRARSTGAAAPRWATSI